MIFVFVEHGSKYYDNVGGIFNMINICKDLKLKGIDVTLVFQNFILKENILEEKKAYENMFNIFDNIVVLKCDHIHPNNICDYFVSQLNMKKSDIIICTLKQYIDIFEKFTQNILIYVHGGGEWHMKNFYPLINFQNRKHNYPVIFYDSYWLSTIKIKENTEYDTNYLIFPFFSVHPNLYPTAQKCSIDIKFDRSCYYIQKNKYKFPSIHKNDNKIFYLQLYSLEQNIKLLSKTKFFYAYDIHSLYVNFALLLRNNIVIPKYQSMNKNEFMEFYKNDSKRNNDIFYKILEKYLIYIEKKEDLDNIKYIPFDETVEYLFDNLINKFHTDKYNNYKEMNDNTISKLIKMINNLDDNKYFRLNMIDEVIST